MICNCLALKNKSRSYGTFMGNFIDFSGRPIHFIGVGGIGMSGLAYVLADRGLPVSGSDLKDSNITRRLAGAGVKVFHTQVPANYESLPLDNGVPQVVCSTAINGANLELKAAIEHQYPIFHRSDVLAAIVNEFESIGVAGTHGKTTTSSTIGCMLVSAGLDPTIVVGGEVDMWGGNARVGKSHHFVAELDESDGSLVKHHPKIGIITNIELDHPDRYKSLEEVIDVFTTFKNNCEITIGSIDCENVKNRIGPDITYSLDRHSGANYTADDIEYLSTGTIASVYENNTLLGRLKLNVLGHHNLSNALAAVAVGRKLGLEFAPIATGLATFTGAKRRFELRGEANDIAFIDDYAHHPTEILVTLAAAKLRVKSPHRVVAVFQPHRYSRTIELMAEFAASFSDADIVAITDIYSAGEPNTTGITGETLVDEIAKHHPQVYYQATLKDVLSFLSQTLKPGDMCLCLGAGNLNSIFPEAIAACQNLESVA
jgi:UDP-N-acetylmuramate--alanine ligase